MKNLILIRGLPGSGKSTLARDLLCKSTKQYPGIATFLFEADQFFMKNEQYEWNAKDIKEAHQTCQYNTSLMLRSYNDVTVIVANTFVTLAELNYYMNLEYDSVTVYDVLTQYASIHNVPEETMRRMASKYVSIEEIKKLYPEIVCIVKTNAG